MVMLVAGHAAGAPSCWAQGKRAAQARLQAAVRLHRAQRPLPELCGLRAPISASEPSVLSRH